MQENALSSSHFDLITPDGYIKQLHPLPDGTLEAIVHIEKISPTFVGYRIDPQDLLFNFKSTLAQIGVNGVGKEFFLDAKTASAEMRVHLVGIDSLGKEMLRYFEPGAFIGKLFARDPRRRVRSPDYMMRMFGRCDKQGRPLLALGGGNHHELVLERIQGRLVAFLKLLDGRLEYDEAIFGLLPVLGKALKEQKLALRPLVQLMQLWTKGAKRLVKPGELLLVRTDPLHIRTMFAHVVEELLPRGLRHTSAAILEPTTLASGDVYELFGSSNEELTQIPLEFYTLEPYREHVFFVDRDQLQSSLEQPSAIFQAFDTAPQPHDLHTAVFVVKGEQLLNLKEEDWIIRQPVKSAFPGLIHPGRQALMVERYIEQQPSYPFLKKIEEGVITSEGILFVRYFPSPLMKKLLIGDVVQKNLKGLYFEKPSFSSGNFFSHEDRSMLLDLAKFAIPVFWVDRESGQILQYVPKPEKDCGMFVPLHLVDTFLKATYFGVYGSNLKADTDFELELTSLLEGIQQMKQETNHPLLSKKTPIALVTGGGPGVMEMGNKVAKSLGILSCANIVDFHIKNAIVNEQKQNPYIEAKMTYRIDRLVERQAEFNLDFPIFLKGGIGTDFEYTLEEVRRKVGSTRATPIILFGEPTYWKQKIASRFQCNLASGTIAGSEWVSNCFFCVQTAKAALKIYQDFFEGTLPIGKHGPIYDDGFATII
ncbi:MAG: LOG family protein [Chlamydiales bacterium]